MNVYWFPKNSGLVNRSSTVLPCDHALTTSLKELPFLSMHSDSYQAFCGWTLFYDLWPTTYEYDWPFIKIWILASENVFLGLSFFKLYILRRAFWAQMTTIRSNFKISTETTINLSSWIKDSHTKARVMIMPMFHKNLNGGFREDEGQCTIVQCTIVQCTL